MGEVISGAKMTAVPLNGRSYTDLLALQPGVVPATSLTSNTQQDIGVSRFRLGRPESRERFRSTASANSRTDSS